MPNKVAADLIEPKGELSRGLFPEDKSEEEFENRLQSYLNIGYSLLTQAGITDVAENATKRNTGAEAYAYFRAYNAIVTRLSATPISAALNDQGSRTYSNEQISRFQGKLDEWYADWIAIIPDLSPPPTVVHSGPTNTIIRY